MARLVISDGGSPSSVLELNLGVNRVGRSPKADFQINHPTISAFHCEFILSDGAVRLRDCGSTNGTFVDDQRVEEATLRAGQTVRLGDVKLLVETTEVTIAIPVIENPQPKPPVVLEDGSILCPRHPQVRATYRCTHCHEVMCDGCVHKLRRKGGATLRLCPLCSHKVELIGGAKARRKTLLDYLRKTVRIPFLQKKERADHEA